MVLFVLIVVQVETLNNNWIVLEKLKIIQLIFLIYQQWKIILMFNILIIMILKIY
jgi:hypothetical protein